MPKIKVNLADIDSDGTPSAIKVAPGRWKAELVECKAEESRAGNDMFVWYWEISEGPSKGEEIRSYTSLLDHALYGLKEHLVAFGSPPDADLDINTDKLVGRSAYLIIGTRKTRSEDTGDEIEVSTVNGVSSSKTASKKDDDEEESRPKASASRDRSRRSSRTSDKSSKKEEPEDDDDDLPF